MWSDNETTVDLCGFDYLVDQLEVVLTKPELRPMTVGLSGGWGSGKSSLMKMARARIEQDEACVCCSFSPWRYEDYDDIKHALMLTVLEALDDRVEESSGAAERLRNIRGLAERLRLAKLAMTGGLMVAGADPVTAAAAGEAAQAVFAVGGERESVGLTSAGEFHDEFERLLDELGDEVAGVYVFVDDLDRCMPETVVDTFEAIRIFLHVHKTAYVIAADPRVVRGAIRSRYGDAETPADDLATDYLEKIWQFTVTIPPLATPEVETFASLLFAQIHLDAEQFKAVREAAAANRARDQLSVAMNYGIARGILGELPEALQRDLELAQRIAPQLSEGLRGNPREIKRFLNTLLLRLEAAKRRGLDLRADLLAKLMILEERHLHRFKELYAWQLESEGAPAAIGHAEKLACGDKADAAGPEAKSWAEDEALGPWLALEPSMAGENLGPYFSYSRDRLSPTVATSRLPGELQALLAPLLGDGDSARQEAVTTIAGLDPGARAMLFAVACDMAVRDPGSKTLRALAEIAKADDSLIPTLVTALGEIPAAALPRATPIHLRTIFGEDEHRFDEVVVKSAARKKGT